MSGLAATWESLPTPALVYDTRKLAATVAAIRTDLSSVPGAELCFAVKANRCPQVLRALAALALGADVASQAELQSALEAGLHPLWATAPHLDDPTISALYELGHIPDLNSLSAVRRLHERHPEVREIGLRLRLPVCASDAPESLPSPWSRFGIDAGDPELFALLSAAELSVSQLHVHAGEIHNAERAAEMLERIEKALERFPRVRTLNLGGGLAELYGSRTEARAVWSLVAAAVARMNRRLGASLRIVVEPGMILLAASGYLVTTVCEVDEHPSGRRLAVVDSSAWNLCTWLKPWVVAQIPPRPGSRPHDIAGRTCYERDYFVQDRTLGELQIGDRLVLCGMGAYCSSMARSSHGFEVPSESVWPSAAEGRCVR